MRESKRSPKPPPSKEIDDGRPARKASPSRKKSRRRSAAAAAPDDGIPDDEVDIVVRVARMMKANKLSQVQVGQEARVSQAVISQWLARKSVATPPRLGVVLRELTNGPRRRYHGHNDKVDKAMEDWLEARRNGTLVRTPRPAHATPARPSARALTGASAARTRSSRR